MKTRRLVSAVVVALATLFASQVLPAVLPGAPPAAAQKAGGCRTINGPFHVRGTGVFNRQGRRYEPYGINLVSLDQRRYPGTVAKEDARIDAAAGAWCSNTVRIMVSQDWLLRNTGQHRRYYQPSRLRIWAYQMNGLRRLVAHARSLGLVVVLNLQVQSDPYPYGSGFGSQRHLPRDLYMPTGRSLKVWRVLARAYGNNPGVVFDLFNEPGQSSRGCAPGQGACAWNHWRNGFTYRHVHYLGMQTLAREIRRTGAHNLIWVEGTQRAVDLSQAWAHHLRGVGAVAYSEHRPPAPHSPKSWTRDFGYLVKRHLAPVMEGEWTNYAVAHKPWACWPDARSAISRWFRYLESVHAGMIATAMKQGQLVRSESDYTVPTTFHTNWACRNGLDQGAGARIMNWFHERNGS